MHSQINARAGACDEIHASRAVRTGVQKYRGTSVQYTDRRLAAERFGEVNSYARPFRGRGGGGVRRGGGGEEERIVRYILHLCVCRRGQVWFT